MTVKRRMSSKTKRLRAEERRANRLREIQRQVESGELVVRQASPDERDRYGIRSSDKKGDASCR